MSNNSSSEISLVGLVARVKKYPILIPNKVAISVPIFFNLKILINYHFRKNIYRENEMVRYHCWYQCTKFLSKRVLSTY